MAPQVIQQIDEIIDLIRSQHPHLTHKYDITIASTFPCFKTPSLFPTTSLLLFNIHQYNDLLQELSFRKNFNVIDIPITTDQLHHDGMHIHVHSLPYIHEYIQQYLSTIIQQQTQSNKKRTRSREAIHRRNKRRHEKLRQRQAIQSVTRPIARIWKLNDLKSYLKYKNIKYNRLLNIRNHQLSIQFNHIKHQQSAEHILTLNDFDENSYHHWIAMKH
jgi:hypothetical protein